MHKKLERMFKKSLDHLRKQGARPVRFENEIANILDNLEFLEETQDDVYMFLSDEAASPDEWDLQNMVDLSYALREAAKGIRHAINLDKGR